MKPVQLVKFSDSASGEKSFELLPEAVKLFKGVLAGRQLYTVGVVGPKRTGKSFFMNALNESNMFPGAPSALNFNVAEGSETNTRGLWARVASDPKSSLVTVFLDSEGLSEISNSDDVDRKLCTLVHLVSKTFFVHVSGRLEREHISLLKFSHELQRELKAKWHNDSSSGGGGGSSEDMLTVENFIVQQYGDSRAVDTKAEEKHLRLNVLTCAPGTERHPLCESKRNHRLFLIPKPANVEPYELINLSRSQFRATYLEKLQEVRNFLSANAGVHEIAGTKLTGQKFAALLEQIVRVLNDIQSTGILLIQEIAEKIAQECFAKFSETVETGVTDLNSNGPSGLLAGVCLIVNFTKDTETVTRKTFDGRVPDSVFVAPSRSLLDSNMSYTSFSKKKSQIDAIVSRCREHVRIVLEDGVFAVDKYTDMCNVSWATVRPLIDLLRKNVSATCKSYAKDACLPANELSNLRAEMDHFEERSEGVHRMLDRVGESCMRQKVESYALTAGAIIVGVQMVFGVSSFYIRMLFLLSSGICFTLASPAALKTVALFINTLSCSIFNKCQVHENVIAAAEVARRGVVTISVVLGSIWENFCVLIGPQNEALLNRYGAYFIILLIGVILVVRRRRRQGTRKTKKE